jgi:carboxyl-terminal processing protease
MKNFIKSLFLVIISSVAIISCTDYDDEPSALPIQNFIWKGLNLYYLYQPNVPNLNDSKFSSQKSLDDYLSGFSSPETLFNSLLYDRATTDKYSVIFSNYTQLEQLLQGTSKSNGMVSSLVYKTGSTTDIFGWVKYIQPGSDASTKTIQRGFIYYAVNGTPLTISNRIELLGQDTYTLNLADYDNGNITPNGLSVTLTKTLYDQNPVFKKDVFLVNTKKVGYLVYNGFYSNYESELNDAFGYFQTENVTDLVLDLRYNGGGSIATATRLASMITGQFTGQLFSKEQWNSKLEPSINPNDLNNNFLNTINTGGSIKSLNLTKVYILTTRSTASASELVINCLKPYITVVQIGNITTGKNVGSITMYDSPTYGKKNVNPNHFYAMQPIVLKVVNKNGFGDYAQGISPDNTTNLLLENLGNLSELGNPNELLLAKALNTISTGRVSQNIQTYKVYDELIDPNTRNLETEMYRDNYPEGLLKKLN